MKTQLLIIAGLCLLFSCKRIGEEQNTDPKNELKTMQEQMQMEAAQKDSTINSFMQSMNEIEENLTTIRVKQKMVTISSKDVELQKTQPERIVDDINSINELLEKNRKTIASMSSKLKKANMNIAEFQKMIARLNQQIEEKDGEITSLREELEKRNVALKTLFSEYNDRIKEMGNQEKLMNTAYFAFGTKKELLEKGVITKEGGFIGIGKNSKVSESLNKDYFTKIDILETLAIPLSAHKAKVLTTHPSNSYKIEGEEGKATKLVITNPQEFWSVSKYLVVIVE